MDTSPQQPQLSPGLRKTAVIVTLVAGVVTTASTLAALFLYASPPMVAATLALAALLGVGLLAWATTA